MTFGVAQLLVLLCLAGEDYYQLLGVSRDADERTIRRAFKKLAISKHPDKDPVSFFENFFCNVFIV